MSSPRRVVFGGTFMPDWSLRAALQVPMHLAPFAEFGRTRTQALRRTCDPNDSNETNPTCASPPAAGLGVGQLSQAPQLACVCVKADCQSRHARRATTTPAHRMQTTTIPSCQVIGGIRHVCSCTNLPAERGS